MHGPSRTRSFLSEGNQTLKMEMSLNTVSPNSHIRVSHLSTTAAPDFVIFTCLCENTDIPAHGKTSKWAPQCPSFCSLSATDINYGGFSQGLPGKVWEKSTNNTSPFSAAQPAKFNWGLGENVGSITSSKNFPQPLDAHVAPLRVSRTFHMCPRDITHYSPVYWLTDKYSI